MATNVVTSTRGLLARPARPVGAIVLVLLLILFGSALPSAVTGASPSPATAGDAPATTLRLSLGRLLSEHAYLTMEGMRATALDTPERDAVATALDSNTTALVGAVGDIYGADAGSGFGRLWQQHIDALLAYAEATARSDTTAAARADDALTTFRAAFGRFLSAANPHLHGDAEAAALRLHLDQLVAYVDGDYARASATGRAAYAHMFELGDHLALKIAEQFPNRFPGTEVAFSPKAELRVALGRLLGEHLVLSAEAMRAGLADSPDASSSAEAIAANTADLGAAIGRIYGQEAGRAFASMWDRHVDAYLGYIESVGSNDAAGQERALMLLHGYHEDVAEFLSGANPHLSRAAVEEMIGRHVESLIAQVDAYGAGDHQRSVNVVGEAYRQMFTVADVLSNAIAAQFPDRFSDVKEIPPTTTASTSALQPADLLVILPAVGILGIAGFALRTRRAQRRPAEGAVDR